MKSFQVMNAVFAFFLEVFSVFVLGYWGFTFQAGEMVQVLLGLAAPVLVCLIWSRWCAPSSDKCLEGAALFLLKSSIFILVTFSLANVTNLLAASIFAGLSTSHLVVSAYVKNLS
ncbi:YrdB family protein [Enterococcus sp. AZ192]|uniref:YrdB family protein n=1 Tax=unclassified Enterococcus TaxID=2608891 RepID=UPI003D2DEF41